MLRDMGKEKSAEYADGLMILAQTRFELGEADRARHLYRHAHSLREGLFGRRSFETAETYTGLALAWRAAGDYRRARQFSEAQYETFLEALGPQDSKTLDSLAYLGSYEGALGNYPSSGRAAGLGPRRSTRALR